MKQLLVLAVGAVIGYLAGYAVCDSAWREAIDHAKMRQTDPGTYTAWRKAVEEEKGEHRDYRS